MLTLLWNKSNYNVFALGNQKMQVELVKQKLNLRKGFPQNVDS